MLLGCGRDSYRFVQDSSRGDDGLEGENPERARECIFARKRFPATLSGICGGDDELERADSERARKQIRMRKGFPEMSSRGMTGWSLKVSKAFGTFRRKRFPESPECKKAPTLASEPFSWRG